MPYPTTFPREAVDSTAADLAGIACPRLTGPREVARRLADLDETYIRANFVPLDDLCIQRGVAAAQVRQDIAARKLPQPAYRLDDGTDFVPDDYFQLVDDAGSVAELPAVFRQRYRRAARDVQIADDAHSVHAVWQDYLGGGYLVCLRHATPENIAQKAALITTLDRLLSQPRPAEQVWCRALRTAVDGLRDIERAGAMLDPPRWGGPMSPQWYGAYLRATYSAAFA